MNIQVNDYQADTLAGVIAELIANDYASNHHLQSVYEQLTEGV